TVASACSSLAARSGQMRGSQDSKERYDGKGLLITEIDPGSLAESAGLKPRDVIFRYGDFEIVDEASYFAAREAYENRRASQIPVVVWRDGAAWRMKVEPGRLGIESSEFSPVSNQFIS